MTHDLLLDLDEARVLGVLIEKSMTTPEQYPLSLNALMNGCNQKSNRSPVLSMDTSAIKVAMQGLRAKQLAVEIWPSGGSRTEKFKHLAETTLGMDDKSVAVIGELLLRRAQMPGELRTRASRMSMIDSQGELKQILEALISNQMVVRLPPTPGSRAERYDHLLCGDLPSDHAAPLDPSPAPSFAHEQRPASVEIGATAAASGTTADLLQRLQALEARVTQLEEQLSGL